MDGVLEIDGVTSREGSVEAAVAVLELLDLHIAALSFEELLATLELGICGLDHRLDLVDRLPPRLHADSRFEHGVDAERGFLREIGAGLLDFGSLPPPDLALAEGLPHEGVAMLDAEDALQLQQRRGGRHSEHGCSFQREELPHARRTRATLQELLECVIHVRDSHLMKLRGLRESDDFRDLRSLAMVTRIRRQVKC